MARILIVEDHENIGQSLKELFAREGFEVETATDLASARAKVTGFVPDLILLDWMLPDGQGLDLLHELRREGLTVPVIFLTAKVEVIDKVLGLEMGANDYVTKPFEPRELLARVRTRLRDRLPSNALPDDSSRAVIRVGGLAIDRVRHQVIYRNAPIHLVKKEFELLTLLAESPEKVFSRDEILNKVWGYDVFPTTRTVDTHVMLLRQKIDPELIETVRAVGYRLRSLSF